MEKKTGKFKKAKTAGKQWDGGQSRSVQTWLQKLNSCFSHTEMLLEAELSRAGHPIVAHTQCIFTVGFNKLQSLAFPKMGSGQWEILSAECRLSLKEYTVNIQIVYFRQVIRIISFFFFYWFNLLLLLFDR